MTEKGHRKISGGKTKHFGEGKCLKNVIGNLAYREMLFYKKALLMNMMKVDLRHKAM